MAGKPTQLLKPRIGLRAWLENEILEGRLRPGERIEEQEICSKFKVSRTPVREAMLQLASIGLVSFKPRQGAVVPRLSVKQIAAMWEVLTGLEGLCAALAARRMSPDEHATLLAVHEIGSAVAAAGTRDIAAYDNANRDFHETIYTGSRNDFLAQHTRDIRRRLRIYRRYPFQRTGGIERSHAGHERVLRAIVAGDDQAAEAEMREHLVGGLSFLDFVADLDGGSGDEHDNGDAPASTVWPIESRRRTSAAGKKRSRG